MKTQAWDAAVIGGGPAGCSAAITLAEHGMRVILFEAGEYPHDKMCGEFLSPECAGLLQGLGVWKQVSELGPVPIRSVTLTAPDGTAWESALPGIGYGLSRKMLDAELAKRARQAGVEVCEASPVTGVCGNLREGFELEVTSRIHSRTFTARSVIGAHGKRAALDRALRRNFLKRHSPYVAMKAHFHGPKIPGRIELHAFPGGYCGMSEIEGDLRVVCFLVHERVFQSVRAAGQNRVNAFVGWMEQQNIFLRSWLQWADRIHEQWISIAQVPFISKPMLEGDMLMAGDAAGLIAPLAGNGISMALDGGILAAGYLAKYLEGRLDDETMKKAYPAAWKRRFGARLALGRILQPLLMQPKAAGTALRLFNALPGLGRLLIKQTRSNPVMDQDAYHSEKKKSIERRR